MNFNKENSSYSWLYHKKAVYLSYRKRWKASRISWIGKLIKLIWKPRQRFIFQWRATPSGSIYAGGLQRERALKTCHSEFHRITGAASL